MSSSRAVECAIAVLHGRHYDYCRGICPQGSHLPANALMDDEELQDFVLRSTRENGSAFEGDPPKRSHHMTLFFYLQHFPENPTWLH